jgi:hypothetical protein
MHSFDPKIAERVGVNAAVLYQNIVWWCAKNAANRHNEHDGRFWTYNSVKAWAELFPYLSAAQIRLALEKLENDGLILSGTFNQVGYDRTKWYCPSEQIHLSESANGVAQKDEPIPVSKPDIKPVDKHSCANDGFSEFWERYPRRIGKAAARKSYAKALKVGTHDDIMFGLSQQITSLTAREAQYIPHPATWLNQERWNDEPEQHHNGRANGTHSRADRPGAGMAQAFAAVAERLSRHPQESDGGGDGFI